MRAPKSARALAFSGMMPPVEIVDLDPSDERVARDLYPVLAELRRHLTAERLTEIYAEGHPQGLRFTVLYSDGRCVAAAGWRIHAATFAGRMLYVDDFVTVATERSRGFGRALLDALVARARDAGCSIVSLDSRVHRVDAHRFYEREGFERSAYRFTRELEAPGYG